MMLIVVAMIINKMMCIYLLQYLTTTKQIYKTMFNFSTEMFKKTTKKDDSSPILNV